MISFLLEEAPLQDYNAYYKNWGNTNKLVKYEVDEMSIHIFHLCEERTSFYYQVHMSYTDSTGTQNDVHLIESGTVMKFDEQSKWEYLNGHNSIIKNIE